MPYVQQGSIVGLILLVTGMAWAGGSHYGITPGSRPQVEGKISEWQVPTPKFARDPAPGPDGNRHCSADSEIDIDRAGARFYTTGSNLLLLRGAHHVRTG